MRKATGGRGTGKEFGVQFNPRGEEIHGCDERTPLMMERETLCRAHPKLAIVILQRKQGSTSETIRRGFDMERTDFMRFLKTGTEGRPCYDVCPRKCAPTCGERAERILKHRKNYERVVVVPCVATTSILWVSAVRTTRGIYDDAIFVCETDGQAILLGRIVSTPTPTQALAAKDCRPSLHGNMAIQAGNPQHQQTKEPSISGVRSRSQGHGRPRQWGIRTAYLGINIHKGGRTTTSSRVVNHPPGSVGCVLLQGDRTAEKERAEQFCL